MKVTQREPGPQLSRTSLDPGKLDVQIANTFESLDRNSYIMPQYLSECWNATL